ncbi:aconitate hydratase AcnA [Paenisporosarcina antarctica]|uniref:Aconitate hydratase n=1 Tax=Paenisporosarcina antarctica TaxID=417367 RepID=A0A4P7A2L6_9BACL|nr:aconitate hydratase AcnA [Paenisporosarcina antarctica]QBP43142.1 aconitate hydratase AcnA [Paenisporosarcina antarctica]
MKKVLTEDVFDVLSMNGNEYSFVNLNTLDKSVDGNISLLPYSIKILLETAVRNFDGKYINIEHIEQLANWKEQQRLEREIPFKPSRILFQDFTGIPALVDLATMREEVNRKGGDIAEVNPQIPVDLVIDHSVIVDNSGNVNSLSANLHKEYEQNNERYRFVKWAQNSFRNFRAVPPSNGIVHQVNLEYLASPVRVGDSEKGPSIYPDSLVGTDSHTPMINGIGIIGWGVGGIEAEAAMLGQPLYFVMPEVVGYKLHGKLQEGVTATDLALTITNLLRTKGVVGKYIEFFGDGLDNISLTDRATIANMAPEYGATMGYFPVDHVAMNYFEETGRGDLVPLAKAYYESQGLYRSKDSVVPEFTETIELDLSIVEPLLAGPKRPQDSIPLANMKLEFEQAISAPIAQRGYGLEEKELNNKVQLNNEEEIKTGSVVLAAISSCTNTSNPSVMIAAGLVAKKAVELGLKKPSFVKSSITPGSRVVTKYLEKAGLLTSLEEIGFFIDGYGCATCCGNSGALDISVEKAIKDNNLLVSSVLSGNRNFEGRIHPLIKANYLGSPPLVVAYALAGTVRIDLSNEPIGFSKDNEAVYLKDIWPSSDEINKVMSSHIKKELFQEEYQSIFENETWSSIPVSEGLLYQWDDKSTYIKEAPYFKEQKTNDNKELDIKKMKTLLLLKDSITTDHISPAGHIPLKSPAGLYLAEKEVNVRDFNNYGARRGNHHVMVRGTFGNIRIRNELANGIEGGFTKYLPTGEIMSVFDAATKYKESEQNLIIIAGKEYGTGSSRDWAAKGTFLLGVKAVLAESFERIHRSNLVGMGVLPLQFKEGENAETLGLDGTETYSIIDLGNDISAKQKVRILVEKEEGNSEFEVIVRLDSKIDVEYYLNGGILHTVLENMLDGMKEKSS